MSFIRGPTVYRSLFLHSAVGMVPSPFDCYLANRGLKTLHLRMREHQRSAMAVAQLLSTSPHVTEAIYPGRLLHNVKTLVGIINSCHQDSMPPPVDPFEWYSSHLFLYYSLVRYHHRFIVVRHGTFKPGKVWAQTSSEVED